MAVTWATPSPQRRFLKPNKKGQLSCVHTVSKKTGRNLWVGITEKYVATKMPFKECASDLSTHIK